MDRYCGGPGECAASCVKSKAWIAAPVVCSVLLAAAIIAIVVLCFRGLCVCRCRVSRKPLAPSSVLASDANGPQVWTNSTTFDRATLCDFI